MACLAPNSDHQSFVPKISALESVRAFEGDLHLLFRSETPAKNLARFDAKTGKAFEE